MNVSLESIVKKYVDNENKFIPGKFFDIVLGSKVEELDKSIFYRNFIIGGYGFVYSMIYMNYFDIIDFFKHSNFSFLTYIFSVNSVFLIGSYFLKRQIDKRDNEELMKKRYQEFLFKHQFYYHPVFFYPFKKQIEINNIKQVK